LKTLDDHRAERAAFVRQLLDQAGITPVQVAEDGLFLRERTAPTDPDVPARPVLLLLAIARGGNGQPNTAQPSSQPAPTHHQHPTTVRQLAIKPPEERSRPWTSRYTEYRSCGPAQYQSGQAVRADQVRCDHVRSNRRRTAYPGGRPGRVLADQSEGFARPQPARRGSLLVPKQLSVLPPPAIKRLLDGLSQDRWANLRPRQARWERTRVRRPGGAPAR
jgi:hypothetical protein